MMLALKRWIATRLQRALGIDEIHKQLAAIETEGRRQTLLLGNAIRYAGMPRESLQAIPAYARGKRLLELLSPRMIEGAKLARIGGPNDGGYVMLGPVAPPTVTAAYSFGVGDEISWDEAIAARGIDAWLYDHTVAAPAGLPARCRFTRKGVTGRTTGAHLQTLAECVRENGHQGRSDLVLKMDVEGAEWDVFEEASESLLGQFQQIVVELHGLTNALAPGRHDAIANVLEKLARTHQCIHVHGNCDQPPVWMGDLVVPDVAEVTYVRRSDVEGQIGGVVRTLPMELDAPNNAGWPEMAIGFPEGE